MIYYSTSFELVYVIFIGAIVVAPILALVIGSVIRDYMGKEPWL